MLGFQPQQILVSHLWQGSSRGLEVNHWDQLTGMSCLGRWPNGLVFAMVLGKIMEPWLNPVSIRGSIKMPHGFFWPKIILICSKYKCFFFHMWVFWLILILAIFKWLSKLHFISFHLLQPHPAQMVSTFICLFQIFQTEHYLNSLALWSLPRIWSFMAIFQKLKKSSLREKLILLLNFMIWFIC